MAIPQLQDGVLDEPRRHREGVLPAVALLLLETPRLCRGDGDARAQPAVEAPVGGGGVQSENEDVPDLEAVLCDLGHARDLRERHPEFSVDGLGHVILP